MAGGKETPERRRQRDEAVTEADRQADAEQEEAAEHLTAAAVPAAANGNGHNARFTAAATSVRFDDRKAAAAMRRRRQAWHDEACDYVKEIGELGYQVEFMANLMSKLRLFPATRPDPGGEPVPADDPDSGLSDAEAQLCVEVLERLKSPQGGQSTILYGIGWNLEVTGDMYLHGHEVTAAEASASDDVLAAGEEQWFVRSVRQLVPQDKWFGLRTAAGSSGLAAIPKDDYVKRIWSPDPEFDELSTSPVRRVLAICENLLLAQRAMRATLMSHLPAGLLLKPQELSFGSQDPTRGTAEGEEADDPFEANLRDTLLSPIQEPGSSGSVAPGVVTGPAEYLKPDVFRHLQFARPIDQLLVSWIDTLVLRLARGLNAPVEVTTGLQECVDTETEILTVDGWRTHDRLQAGDRVLTLDHDTGMAEWQETQRVARYEVDGQELLLIERKSHSSLTTLNHRWPVLRVETGNRLWRRSDELKAGHRFQTAALLSDPPTEAKWTDDFVELVAWFYTEGSVDRRAHRGGGGNAIITQSAERNPENVDRIRAALTRTFGAPAAKLNRTGPSWKNPDRQQVVTWIERRDPNRPMARFRLSHSATAALEEAAPDRVPTHEFLRSLSRAQLELFLDVSRLGDGWTTNTGTRMFSQTDRRRLGAYEFAVILSGRTPSTWTVQGSGRYADREQHYCSVTDRTTVAPLEGWYKGEPASRRVRYSGTVWCPQVPNGTWLARRHGRVYFTGNTTYANAAQVKKSEWDSHGEPRATLIVDSLTAGYYREALVKSGLPAERAVEVFVWYDPSACIAAPDPTDSADHGSQEGLIRDETWRRTRGFSDADAPTDDELLRRLAYAAPRMDPFLAAQLWKKTGMFPDVQIPAPPSGILGDDGQIQGGPPAPAAIAAAVMAEMAAAAKPRKGRGAALGRRLMQIDRDLRLRVQVAAEQALRRALERAGAKIRPKLGRTGPAAEAAAGVPNRLLAATVGRDVVAAATQGTLDFGAEFDELADDVGSWVEVAWRQAIVAVQSAYGPISDARMAELEARRGPALEAAQAQLMQRMADLAAARLFDPTPGAAAIGETDAAGTVPAYIAREALALAGGDRTRGGDGAPLTSEDGTPVGGVATGPDVMGETGGVEGYVWDYGSAPRAPFPPHEALDGTTVTDLDDPAWANDSGWPADQCLPGDHDGCVCDLSPVLIDPTEADSVGGEGE